MILNHRNDGNFPDFVAIHGFKRAGKGAIATHLSQSYGYQTVKFAGVVKNMTRVLVRRVSALDSATIERCIEGDLKEIPAPFLGGKSTRYVMQVIGSEWRSAISDGMWVNLTIAMAEGIINSGERVVLDDLRFPHEFRALQNFGAALWLVTNSRNWTGTEFTDSVPWDIADHGSFNPGRDVLVEMVNVLAEACGVPGLNSEAARTGLDVLGGRSIRDGFEALNDVWMPLMLKPWVFKPAGGDVHVSERGLPPEDFSVHIRNDSTLEALNEAVDGELLNYANSPRHDGDAQTMTA